MKIIDVPQSILNLLALCGEAAATDWGAPETLVREPPPVPVPTQDMLPPELWPLIEDIARRVQCPPDYVAAAAMVMIGSVVGSGCAIRPKQKDNWSEVPNIWGAIVGPPGAKKSPAVGQVMQMLYRLDSDAQQEFVHASLSYSIEIERYKQALEAYKKQTKAAVGGPTTHPGPMPVAPVRKRYFTNDTTIEALGELISENPRGCLVNHDELTGLLAGFQRTGREGERQAYLTAWNGQHPHQVDRIGRGHIYIERFCASVFGGIQPDKLEGFLSNTHHGLDNDGFMQRLQVMVYPDPITITGIVDEHPNEQARERVWMIVRTLANSIEQLKPQVDGHSRLPFFRFEKKVQTAFNTWLLDLEQRVQNEESPLMAEHLSKYRKLVPALALIIHLIGIASNRIKAGTAVQHDSLERAIKYAHYLEAHARRVFAISTNRDARTAQLLGKKLSKGALVDGFNVREVVRHGWSGLTDQEEVKAACDELEQANWIRRRPSPSPRAGGRPPSLTYDVNPAVSQVNSATSKPTKLTKRKAK